MAGNSVIGALRVVLGADTAELEAGLKSASSSVAKFANGLKGALAIAGIASVGAALASSLKGAVDQADKLSKSSQKIGIPTEQLSALKYAADLSDVSMESLEKSVSKLSRTMTEAAAKPTSEAANAFRALGVSVTDSNGKLRPTQDVLFSIADKFSGLKDGAGKTAVAMAIFGRAGADMIPLLNAGKSGIQELMDEARQLGIVISSETGKSAEEFNDNLKRLKVAHDGLVMQIVSNMLPHMQKLSAAFVEISKNSGFAKDAANAIGLVMNWVAGEAMKLSVTMSRAAADFMAFFNFVGALGSFDKSKISAAWDEWGKSSQRTKEAFDQLGVALQKLWGETQSHAASTDKATRSQKDFNYGALGGKNAIDSYVDSLKKRAAGLAAEIPLVGKSNSEIEKAKLVAEGLALAEANRIPITDALRQKLEAVAAPLARMNEALSIGKQAFEQTRTPAEQYQATIERLNLALQSGAMNADTYARSVAQAQDKLIQANPYAQAVGSSLENAFGKAIEGGSKLSDILKGLLKDLARMIANAAFRQLLYGDSGQGGTFGGILGGLFGGLFGGARAMGGPVVPSQAYMVGERGPEMFVPRTSGQIISTSDLASGGGGSVVVNSSPTFINSDPSTKAEMMAFVLAQNERLKKEIKLTIGKSNLGYSLA